MNEELVIPEVISFEWDTGNLLKSKIKHKVDSLECEQIFHNDPVYFFDEKHSQKEKRYAVYGEADQGRKLFIIFTIRDDKIRVISARDQSKKERRVYEKNKTNAQI